MKIQIQIPPPLVVFSVVLSLHRCSAIVNGKVVKIADAKWVVALMEERTDEVVCTAALIELDWVITSAGCVERFGIHDVLYVLAGIDTMEDKNAAQKSYVMYWHMHPCYVKMNSYDIALMKLSFKIEGSAASTIKLSAEPWPTAEMYGRQCTSTGWGSNMVETFTANGTRIDKLRYTNLTTGHGTSGCPCTMRNDQKRLVCSTNGGQALCFRDFGGLLVCEGSAVAVAHKLVSTKCSDKRVKDCRNEDIISSYVFICPFLPWIKKFVPSVSDKPDSCFSPSVVSTRSVLIWSGMVLGEFWWFYDGWF